MYKILQRKHPSPHRNALVRSDGLPELENIEVTGSMVHKAAFVIQGGAGPGGCTATRWQNVLLRYGTCSDHLREAVASLIRLVANSIVSWDTSRHC